jgi:CheY-like chemotaxis protein
LDGPAGKVPVIALTASAFKEDRMRAEQAGMNDFIAKPFGEAELVQKCFSWTSDPHLGSPGEWAHEAGLTDPSEAAPNHLDKYPADFVRSVLQIFLETAPPVFERLVVSIQNADWEQAKTSAHWLRGGASRAIAPDLQDQLAHIESVCATGPTNIPTAKVEALISSFRQACDSAEKWMENDRKYSTSPVEPSVS